MSKIIITGAFRFPDGDAAAARVLALGIALRAKGQEVVFCGWESRPRSEDIDSSGVARYMGFKYYSQAEFRSTYLNPIRRLYSFLVAGRNTLNWLNGGGLNGVDAIIAYHGRSLFLLSLFRLCRANKVRLIFDCTEWYGGRQFADGRFGISALDNAIRMRIINRIIGIGIVVSGYLRNYYSSRGAKVICVPPLVDARDHRWQRGRLGGRSSAVVSLVYAGTPGMKDLLGTIIQGIARAKSFGANVVLRIVGPDEEAVRRLLGKEAIVLEQLAGCLHFYGRVPYLEVPSITAEADFSVLLRRLNRHSSAGFPTKIVESLVIGVPVICNLTSDLGRYIEDGREGLIVKEPTSVCFAETLLRAAKLTSEERTAMRSFARMRGRSCFDYREYADDLNALVVD